MARRTDGVNHQGWIYRRRSYFSERERVILEPMFIKKGYVLEHRAVVALALGRPLKAGEAVHHINGIRDDNRLENLELGPAKDHALFSLGESARITKLEAGTRELEMRVRERDAKIDKLLLNRAVTQIRHGVVLESLQARVEQLETPREEEEWIVVRETELRCICGRKYRFEPSLAGPERF